MVLFILSLLIYAKLNKIVRKKVIKLANFEDIVAKETVLCCCG